MIFTYQHWDNFCRELAEKGVKSIPTRDIKDSTGSYVVLKHDVETNVSKAYQLAAIEHKYGHRGSYYVQAYLMHDEKNIFMLREMQEMGHEISYHYDVMDSSKGDLDKAIKEFADNKQIFEKNGFVISTVCQHGNPVVERVGYTSNRDFFRNDLVRSLYPKIRDVMVNLKNDVPTDFVYFSDAGRVFKMIFDPLNNDIVNSDDKNIAYKNLDKLIEALDFSKGIIISTHPHRWCGSAAGYLFKTYLFKAIRAVAKMVMRIPLAKKIMSKYYYLAKKI